jgi:hypothetical protein
MTQAFIYFRHTPRGVELFASRELCRRVRTAGTTKTHYSRVPVLTSADPLYGTLLRLMDGMLTCARSQRVRGQTPTVADLTKFVEPVAAAQKIDAALLPAAGILPLRILVRG